MKSDKLSKIFSVVILDGDVEDTIRIVQKAVKENEICGAYAINKPDFEFENFNIAELSEIIFKHQEEKKISLKQIQEATRESKSGKDFFTSLNTLSRDFKLISKGESWGIELVKYAFENNSRDRKIYDIVNIISNCNNILYEISKNKCVEI